MGVKGLNSWIAASFPGVMKPAAQGGKGKFSRPAPPPCPYDHVMLDANGIVHRACRSRSSEREVIRAIVCEIDAVLRAYPARESVLIALDGPGPLAKLLEQRKRRIERVLKAGRDAEAAVVGSKEYLRRAEIAERMRDLKALERLSACWDGWPREAGIGGVFYRKAIRVRVLSSTQLY